jgi:hypothetical protein
MIVGDATQRDSLLLHPSAKTSGEQYLAVNRFQGIPLPA